MIVGEDNKAEGISTKINGKLCGVMIEADNNISIIINTVESRVVLFSEVDYKTLSSNEYIALQKENTACNNERLNFSSSAFYLNDKVRVAVEGSVGTTIKITLRYI